MANQMKKRVHAAKVRAADKTTLIVHPNVREDIGLLLLSPLTHFAVAGTSALTGIQLKLGPFIERPPLNPLRVDRF